MMDYCVTTPVLKPYSNWDGISTDYKFEVMVKTHSDYPKCLDIRRSMTGNVVYLSRAKVTFGGSFRNSEFVTY